MSPEETEERAAESIFEDAPQSAGEEEETRCLACRVWWKVAIVLVLVAVVAGIIIEKRRPQKPAAGDRGASEPMPEQRGSAADSAGSAQEAPDTVLATVNGEKITLGELERALRDMPDQYKSAFKNSKHELLEQLISRELLLQEARRAGAGEGQQKAEDSPASSSDQDEDQLIDALLQREALSQVEVDEEDLKAFYEEHKDELPGERSFAEVKDALRPYVRQEKQQAAIEAYLKDLTVRAEITRNEAWIEAQKALADDNPLDRALKTGVPVVADFGRGVCIPCKMMKPILDELKEQYAGRAEILIIEIDEYPAVTQRAGIQAIPTQIFYDAEGNVVHRHQGFMPRDAIVEQLRKMGVE